MILDEQSRKGDLFKTKNKGKEQATNSEEKKRNNKHERERACSVKKESEESERVGCFACE